MKMKSLVLILSVLISVNAFATECVQVYFDRGPSDYWMGRTYATMTQNLLGHFPELQQIVSPIELYKKGDLEKCRASIYMGSYFNSQIPEAFFSDYVNTKKNVAWLGYGIWRHPDLLKIWGFDYKGLTALNQEKLDSEKKPSFFKWINYKGERFFKYGDWSRSEPKTFLAPFEMIKLEPSKELNFDTAVLATSTHNVFNETVPYILRNKNHFYVADIPFSFIHEADRYLVFSDLLFDILDLPPRHKIKPAIIRMEDVHPMMEIEFLHLFSNTLKAEQVPLLVSLVPYYFDPFNREDHEGLGNFVMASDRPLFVKWIQEVRDKQRASFIWHGVTHQYLKTNNPHNGVTGSDFEFWDAVKNQAIEKDSVSWVLDRLYDGYHELVKIGVQPFIWLTPHYQASTLDNLIFSRVMPWNIGRVIYYNFNVTTPSIPYHRNLWFTDLNAQKQKNRIDTLSKMSFKTENAPWSGQYYPYEIYGDVHGQRLLPENLGNSQPFENDHVIRPRSVEQMVADAKRNLVIRDSWASYFYHPFLFASYDDGGRGAYYGDPHELVFLIRELKKLGYTFIHPEDFAKANVNSVRPEPIYILKESP